MMPPAKPKKAPSKTNRTTRVRQHSRTTQTGKRVHVKSHNRTITAWQQAGIAWAGTAATGATTLAMVVEFGFALISTIVLLLTLLLGVLATAATAKASAPRRKMRAKTSRWRPPTKKRRRH